MISPVTTSFFLPKNSRRRFFHTPRVTFCYRRLFSKKKSIQKTNIKSLKIGDLINLERCLSVGDRLDGHFVQGHIDCSIKCCEIGKQNGSWMFKFQCPKKYTDYLTEKGSISLNGISLTIASLNDSDSSFNIAIIPYTFKHTNFNKLKKNDYVNVEFDIISKQIARLNQKK